MLIDVLVIKYSIDKIFPGIDFYLINITIAAFLAVSYLT